MAFRGLVQRHMGLVYSVAWRHLRSASLASEVAQSVFIDLARRAPRPANGHSLVGWLHLVARRTAIDLVRKELRRQVRETEAAYLATMKSTEPDWSELESVLDEALSSLRDVDRQAVLLRYFENRSLREVGHHLGTSEAAAQKRVTRAVEDLRRVFQRRGITLTSVGLVSQLSAHAVVAVPEGLGATLASLTASVQPSLVAPILQVTTMSTVQKSLLVASLALVGFLGYENSTLASDIDRLDRQDAVAVREVSLLQAERDADELRLRKSGADLQVAHARSSAAAEVESSLAQWLDRVAQLKARLDQFPNLRIPEMKYLTSSDWLDVTLDNKLQTAGHVRMALARLRDMAQFKPEIGGNLQRALEAFDREHPGKRPAAMADLAPYLSPPLDQEILARYDFGFQVPVRPGAPEVWGLGEVDIIDEDFDTKHSYTKSAISFRGAGTLRPALGRAIEAFKRARPVERPSSVEELLPYFDVPVDPARLRDIWPPPQ